MTNYQKLQKLLLFLVILFTIIVIGLTIGVVINNDLYSFDELEKYTACRKALFTFTAFDALSIIGLVITYIFKVETKENK